MPTIAAIDVGSNALRLAVGNVDGERRLTILENLREPVRLGADVFTRGTLSDESIERAVQALLRFRSVIEMHGAKWTRAVATSAAREALNRELFLDRVAQETGIELAVINAEEEARLIHLGVAESVRLDRKLAMLIDIGGGSAEITLSDDGTIISTESFRLGAVRLLQVLDEKKLGEKQFNQLAREYLDAAQKRFKREIGDKAIDLCVGTGGNIEALGDLRREVLGKEKDTVLTAEELDILVRKLQGMSFDERVSELRLRPDRADVIVPASMVLQKIVKQARVEEILIPRVGLKDGLLIDMIEELYGERKHAYRDQVMTAALQVGRRYTFDELHGTTVARYAARLFDETRVLHNLGVEYRVLLEVAALLHDIGTIVSLANHHKHSHYLLSFSPVVGLSQAHMAVVANVARYHRKSFPKVEHDHYRVLASKDRVVVTKLAALLRVADALDNEHAARVSGFTVEFRKPRVVLRLEGEGDLLLERWALAKKSALFEETFGVKLAVEK